MRSWPLTLTVVNDFNGSTGALGDTQLPNDALQELELDVVDAVYLIEEFVGNARCLVLSKTPQITDRIDELTEACNSELLSSAEDK